MPFDINNFTPTHTINNKLAEEVCYEKADGEKRYKYESGQWARIHKDFPPIPYVAPDVTKQVAINEGADYAVLHAEAACTALMAATLPEWACSRGSAYSARGDSADVLNERGPNGEKVVKICTVSPGRVTEWFEILVPEFVKFEIRKKV